jgi:hypothetical protein
MTAGGIGIARAGSKQFKLGENAFPEKLWTDNRYAPERLSACLSTCDLLCA